MNRQIREVKQIKTTYINKTENYIIGEDVLDVDKSVIQNLTELYNLGSKNYGRCISKIYIDQDNKALHIGYVFIKKEQYQDTKENYIREVWLTIEHYKETIIKEYFTVK